MLTPRIMKLHRDIDHDWQMTPMDFQVTSLRVSPRCSFVLVGDSKQLPPVVLSKEARELGMDESMFLHLNGQQATFELHLQYRMDR
ncbi:hypothetical protein DPMN_055844 [Dreissena polymorpha]|uniref:DNA2/NAM7 helicase helicase domain-containing protein n=1 Tax=Dreissena polymorpha TaxID=45954 RepID=A0A9D4HSY4_DREPO|nr:hypothetical protein DPMN_055844 [Dreissena polymorpha]